ncbi:cell adhesion molecule 2 [Anabrus simplex]|uniref:cell adhesion molecule 2 n=1 Tax=Anabrus simplex TaxID=316456 RepID=UPI0035A34F9B
MVVHKVNRVYERHNVDHSGLSCLKLLLLDVPQYKFRGDTVLLQCVFDLQSDRLYSVTWYKDHEEFYRFVPKANLPQHSYHLDGVDVDHHSSDSQKVLLRNVSLKTSGLYRCEVSAEAPSFTSVHGEGRMEVVSLPKENPEITGEERLYQVGDVISLNCTSDSSFPPAVIRWYINDEPVSPDFETEVDSQGLYSSISTLQFKVEPKHFVDGRMKVRCVSTVSTETDNVLEHSVEPLIDNREALLLVRGCGALQTACGLLTLLMTSLVTWFTA